VKHCKILNAWEWATSNGRLKGEKVTNNKLSEYNIILSGNSAICV
jgi:hypothetical protein